MINRSQNLLSTALHCRCPACGHGALFRGFLEVRDRCDRCHVDLSGQDSGDGPAPFIIFLVGAIVVGLALFTEVHYQPSIWQHLLLWLPLTAILVLSLMRPAKALMIALQYKHRREDFKNGS
ncbi:MAG: DUF983 domain-containing protein [Geminicoccaceae bacterium]